MRISAEKEETLCKLWNDGFSASIIAERLGFPSRNSVIGKIHRMRKQGRDLRTDPNQFKWTKEKKAEHNKRGSERKQKAVTSEKRKGRPPKVRTQREIIRENVPSVEQRFACFAEPNRALLDITELDAISCKWPYGEQSPFRYCGHQIVSGQSYCEQHFAMSYRVAN